MDDLGNRDGTQSLRDGSVSFAVDTATNRYTSVGGNFLDYDNAGNLTEDKDGYAYTYDCENRITRIVDDQDTLIAEYDYDAFGRRIRSYDALADSTTLYYYSDGWQVLAEHDGSSFTNEYVYGNDVTEPLVVNDGANDYFYLHDHLYSTVALVNSAGAVVERYEYDAYGKATVWNAALTTTYTASQYANPYLFAGYRFDANTGLYHTLYRSYDPYAGRWLQHDPLGYADSMSLYEYVMSNPTRYTDPLGMFSSAYESDFSAWDRWRYEHGMIGGWLGLSPEQAARMDKYYPNHIKLTENPAYGDYGIIIEIKGVYNTCCKEKPFMNTSKEMGIVWADSVTFGYFDYWHEPAEQYRLEAMQRRDVMTQVGHGLSQFSATTTQAAAMALGLQAGLGATGATTSLETLLANHPALALRLQALGIMSGIGIAGMEVNNAQTSFEQGDIAHGVSSSCNAGLTVLLICLPVKNGATSNSLDDFDDATRISSRSLKDIIEGSAHGSTPGHKFRTYREAIKMARSGNYQKVYINRGYNNINGVKVTPNRRPDVLGIRLSGQADAIEVLSRTDDVIMLIQRNEDVMNQLPLNMRGNIDVVKPR